MDAGRIGLCIVLAGMMGSVCCGIVLDKTHRFKYDFILKTINRSKCIDDKFIYLYIFFQHRETTLAVYAFSMIGMWIYTFTLNVGHISIVYVTSSLLG